MPQFSKSFTCLFDGPSQEEKTAFTASIPNNFSYVTPTNESWVEAFFSGDFPPPVASPSNFHPKDHCLASYRRYPNPPVEPHTMFGRLALQPPAYFVGELLRSLFRRGVGDVLPPLPRGSKEQHMMRELLLKEREGAEDTGDLRKGVQNAVIELTDAASSVWYPYSPPADVFPGAELILRESVSRDEIEEEVYKRVSLGRLVVAAYGLKDDEWSKGFDTPYRLIQLYFPWGYVFNPFPSDVFDLMTEIGWGVTQDYVPHPRACAPAAISQLFKGEPYNLVLWLWAQGVFWRLDPFHADACYKLFYESTQRSYEHTPSIRGLYPTDRTHYSPLASSVLSEGSSAPHLLNKIICYELVNFFSARFRGEGPAFSKYLSVPTWDTDIVVGAKDVLIPGRKVAELTNYRVVHIDISHLLVNAIAYSKKEDTVTYRKIASSTGSSIHAESWGAPLLLAGTANRNVAEMHRSKDEALKELAKDAAILEDPLQGITRPNTPVILTALKSLLGLQSNKYNSYTDDAVFREFKLNAGEVLKDYKRYCEPFSALFGVSAIPKVKRTLREFLDTNSLGWVASSPEDFRKMSTAFRRSACLDLVLYPEMLLINVKALLQVVAHSSSILGVDSVFDKLFGSYGCLTSEKEVTAYLNNVGGVEKTVEVIAKKIAHVSYLKNACIWAGESVYAEYLVRGVLNPAMDDPCQYVIVSKYRFVVALKLKTDTKDFTEVMKRRAAKKEIMKNEGEEERVKKRFGGPNSSYYYGTVEYIFGDGNESVVTSGPVFVYKRKSDICFSTPFPIRPEHLDMFYLRAKNRSGERTGKITASLRLNVHKSGSKLGLSAAYLKRNPTEAQRIRTISPDYYKIVSESDGIPWIVIKDKVGSLAGGVNTKKVVSTPSKYALFKQEELVKKIFKKRKYTPKVFKEQSSDAPFKGYVDYKIVDDNWGYFRDIPENKKKFLAIGEYYERKESERYKTQLDDYTIQSIPLYESGFFQGDSWKEYQSMEPKEQLKVVRDMVSSWCEELIETYCLTSARGIPFFDRIHKGSASKFKRMFEANKKCREVNAAKYEKYLKDKRKEAEVKDKEEKKRSLKVF
jgi:hypothetical protein